MDTRTIRLLLSDIAGDSYVRGIIAMNALLRVFRHLGINAARQYYARQCAQVKVLNFGFTDNYTAMGNTFAHDMAACSSLSRIPGVTSEHSS